MDDLYELVNAELVKQAQDILALGEYDDYDNAIADMVERLTAVWYSGYEFGMEDRLNEGISLELDEEAEL